MISPAKLNADSDATVDAGTLRMSRAIREMIEYFGPCNFHHEMMSNTSLSISG
jgi:hypothetical protein